jgi:hypothetical protein
MKLKDIANIVSPGDATTLSGGKLPNAYKDNDKALSKHPRTKKKDMYGSTNLATGADIGAGDSGGTGAPAGDGGGGGGE